MPELGIDPAARAELVPSGTLRAAINFGNPVLATKDPATGEPGGLSVDLAKELARRLGVPITFVTYDSAGQVVKGLEADSAWDVCFLAIDPLRAETIRFTAPYAVIEGVYMVARDSPLKGNVDVDHPNVRVGVVVGSAYDLFLSRELKHATIVRSAGISAVMAQWDGGELDAVAGVKPPLAALSASRPGTRLLPERFMAINQAMGLPARRESGARYLRAFVDDVKASGFVAEAFARNRVDGAAIAE
jgi:polar amino acid transport system substrate-binding protein